MSDTFNPTHRVINTGGYAALIPATLVRKFDEGFGQLTMYHDRAGSCWYLKDDYVEPIQQEEPVKLEPGKRYRWTVEGTASDYGLVLGLGWALNHDYLAYGKLELLPDPLPTTPGSVVRDRNGYLNVRADSSTYGWVPLHAAGQWRNSDDQVSPATVLFDAGARSKAK